MGVWDVISEMLSVRELHAEEQQTEEEEDDASDDSGTKADDESGEEEGGEEEEEEEEEEPEDPKPAIEQECAESKECKPHKHHYEQCVERVTKKQEEGKLDEDCVEEYFHMMHCVSHCAAPKLFKVLK